MPRARRPAGDLIEAIVENMRANLEELRYSTVAPSRYTVYLSPAEFERLQGLFPRLRSEAIRALDEELARLDRRRRPHRVLGRLLGRPRPLEQAEGPWHVEFLPDLDDELQHEQDILVQSELAVPAAPELGAGERTRRVTTVHGSSAPPTREELPAPAAATAGATQPVAFAHLSYEDQRGTHRYDLARESTTIGRGGLRFPVDVRVVTSDEVSREHARIRRDAASGACFLIDLSTHGTTLDGQPVPRGYEDDGAGKRENGMETPLPPRARIGLAGRVVLEFVRLQ
jgi:pSer/pThr/pTyr-binding forkhead associated (FHA) protein